MERLIAVTGGIGAGKSVVCRILGAMGYEVYDCDSRARALMDASPSIKNVIAGEICPEAVDGDRIDRRRLSEGVFSDRELLEKLNSAVHGAVRHDIEQWRLNRRTAFVETAILYQSGLDRMVDEVWEVVAPEDLRIRRVMARSGLMPDEVRCRIESQRIDVTRPHACLRTVVNDDVLPLLPQIESLLDV